MATWNLCHPSIGPQEEGCQDTSEVLEAKLDVLYFLTEAPLSGDPFKDVLMVTIFLGNCHHLLGEL